MPGGKSLQLVLPFQSAASSGQGGSSWRGKPQVPPCRGWMRASARHEAVDGTTEVLHPAACVAPSRDGAAAVTGPPGSGPASGAAAELDQVIERSGLVVVPAGDLPDILALAYALIPPATRLSRPESDLVQTLPAADPAKLATVRRIILAGDDPLGDILSALRTAEQRRATGAIFTPAPIVGSMVAWAAAQGVPARVVDAGAGSGRFVLAAGMVFPEAHLVAIDTDPQALLVLRANAALLGLSRRLTVLCGDYRQVRLEPCEGRTLFLANPPYLRHHAIPPDAKEWFAKGAVGFGLRASKLAGLHVHFFVRTWQLAQPGDYGAFVTSAEWLDVKYGSILRGMLVAGLGGTSVHVVAADAMPFDAITTAAITTFEVGRRRDILRMRTVGSLGELGNLEHGAPVPLETAKAASRWSVLARGDRPLKAAGGHIQLGELFDVHRGQVTGANDVWITGGYGRFLPPSVLFPTITRAREIIAAGGILNGVAALRQVVDLPAELDTLDPTELPAVRAFVRWAKSRGADQPYVARHRKAWWAVGLKPPAPIICTYMARRPPAFAYNPHGVRHINIAHGLYPRQKLQASTLAALTAFLNNNVRVADGRTYAGGLTKFEPSEIQRLYIPDPATLHGTP